MYGDMIEETTKSARAVPQRLIDKGFEFKYESLDDALGDIFSKHSPLE
jgi:NAD dependent epimerase/dehydratase family enzyme